MAKYLMNKKYLEKHKINCLFALRILKYYITKYRIAKDKEVEGNTLYLIIDPDREYAGLIDRIKAIVSCFYIAKNNKFEFKIISNEQFPIWDFLTPNQYNSRANLIDLSFSIQNCKIISYNGYTINKLNKKIKQYHIYDFNGKNVLETNLIPNYERLFMNLFQELFVPNHCFVSQKLDTLSYQENSYIAIHLRFVNALETFEPNYKKILTPKQKQNLIDRCIDKIEQIKNEYNNKDIVCFSDSTLFLNEVTQKVANVIVLDGIIGHISHTDKRIMHAVTNKTFLDFFMISRAFKVFSIFADELYKSAFPRYAAMINNKEYQIIQV
jgi:hypothetical protein